MKHLSTGLLRHSANVLGYEVVKRNDGLFDVYQGSTYRNYRPGIGVLSSYFVGVKRKVVAEHLLEVAISRIGHQAKYEREEEAAEQAA